MVNLVVDCLAQVRLDHHSLLSLSILVFKPVLLVGVRRVDLLLNGLHDGASLCITHLIER